MKYNDKMKEDFRENLALIRKAAGWSENEFGNRLGLTRQTISNLENQNTELSKVQYLAMRYVINDEIINSKDDCLMLKLILDAFVDNPEKYKDKDRENIRQKANMLVPALVTKNSSRKEVSDSFKELMKIVGAGAIAAFIAAIGISGIKKN